jgi:hypothetical protein
MSFSIVRIDDHYRVTVRLGMFLTLFDHLVDPVESDEQPDQSSDCSNEEDPEKDYNPPIHTGRVSP